MARPDSWVSHRDRAPWATYTPSSVPSSTAPPRICRMACTVGRFAGSPAGVSNRPFVKTARPRCVPTQTRPSASSASAVTRPGSPSRGVSVVDLAGADARQPGRPRTNPHLARTALEDGVDVVAGEAVGDRVDLNQLLSYRKSPCPSDPTHVLRSLSALMML